jgi:hypothetical protein
LESGRGISETKEHNERFKHSTICLKSSLPLVAFLDANVVIPPTHVKLGEDCFVLEFIHDVGNEREGILISNGLSVELAIVLYQAKFTILLLYKEERRSKRGFGGANVATLQHVLEEIIKCCLFEGRERIHFTARGEFFECLLFKDLSIVEIVNWHQFFQSFDLLLGIFSHGKFCGLSGATKAMSEGIAFPLLDEREETSGGAARESN